MVRIIVILIICIVNLSACTPTFQPVCRHKAIYAAIVVGEKYPVQIARGRTENGGYHAQARYKPLTEWKWLSVDDSGFIFESNQDGFYPLEYWNVDTYFQLCFGQLTNIAGYGTMITNTYGDGKNGDNSMQTMSRRSVR